MKKLFFLILLSSATLKVFSQSTALPPETGPNSLNTKKNKHTIWLNLGQISRNEIQMSYEHLFNPETALELSLGYKYAEHKGQPFDVNLSSVLSLDTYDYAERMPFSEGILISLGLKGYMISENHSWFKTYLSPSLFYRNRFYDLQFVSSTTLQPDKRFAGESLQSLDLRIYGAKFLFGHTIDMVVFNDQKKILLDLYYGFGFRHKKAKTSYYNYNRADYGSPNVQPTGGPTIEKAKHDWASLHAGLRLGFQF